MGLKETWNNFKAERAQRKYEDAEYKRAMRTSYRGARLEHAAKEGEERAKYDSERSLKSYRQKKSSGFGIGFTTKAPNRSSGNDMLGGSFMGLDFGGSSKPHHHKKKSHKGKKKVTVWV
jgi:hypothetical protein